MQKLINAFRVVFDVGLLYLFTFTIQFLFDSKIEAWIAIPTILLCGLLFFYFGVAIWFVGNRN